MILYHGTSTKHLDSILEGGLVPNKSSNWDATVQSKDGYVYLSDTYSGYFAMQCTGLREDGEEPVILKVEVDEDSLYPDEDFIAQVQFMFDKDLKGMMSLNDFTAIVDPSDHQSLWLECLNNFGNVAHKGPIEAECIADYVVLRNQPHILSWLDPSITITNHRFCSGNYKALTELMFDEITSEEYIKRYNKNFGIDQIKELQGTTKSFVL